MPASGERPAAPCSSSRRCSAPGHAEAARSAPTARDTRAPDTAPAVELVALPRTATKRCAEFGPRRDVPVLCPTRLPDGDWRLRYQSLEHNRRAYLPDFRTRDAGAGIAHHVLAGGRQGKFPLHTWRGKWLPTLPLARDLQLVGSTEGRRAGRWKPLRLDVGRQSRVAGRSALILRAADFPDGGIHGATSGSSGTRAGTATH